MTDQYKRDVTPAMLEAELGMAAGTPGAIEASEKAGTDALARDSDRLPIESNVKQSAVTAATGITFGEPVDELFVSVSLPAGWAIRTTGHPMWTDLVDDAGNLRATIFYKAAFYDRRASISWVTDGGGV